MKMNFYIRLIAAAFVGIAAHPAIADDAAVYRVEAHDIDEVDLRICSPSRLLVRGDGDTDLDFAVVGPTGLMHVDVDGTDWTASVLEPKGYGCTHFSLLVENNGNVYNRYFVRLVEL